MLSFLEEITRKQNMEKVLTTLTQGQVYVHFWFSDKIEGGEFNITVCIFSL